MQLHPVLTNVLARFESQYAYHQAKETLPPIVAKLYTESNANMRCRMVKSMYPNTLQTWIAAALKRLRGENCRSLSRKDFETPKRAVISRSDEQYPKIVKRSIELLDQCNEEDLSAVFRWNSPNTLRDLIKAFENNRFPKRVMKNADS